MTDSECEKELIMILKRVKRNSLSNRGPKLLLSIVFLLQGLFEATKTLLKPEGFLITYGVSIYIEYNVHVLAMSPLVHVYNNTYYHNGHLDGQVI